MSNLSQPSLLGDIQKILFSDNIVKISEDLAVFPGHFPSSPMLPGIYSIQIALKYLEKTLQHRVKLHSIQRCKFNQPLLPGMTVYIESKLGIKDGNLQNVRIIFLNENNHNPRLISEINLAVEIIYE